MCVRPSDFPLPAELFALALDHCDIDDVFRFVCAFSGCPIYEYECTSNNPAVRAARSRKRQDSISRAFSRSPFCRNVYASMSCVTLNDLPCQLPEGFVPLPPSLKSLTFDGTREERRKCHGLEFFPNMPLSLLPSKSYIVNLKIRPGSLLPYLPPPSVRTLVIRNCKNVKRLPRVLPPALKTLVCEGCDSLSELPERLPNALEVLRCVDCPRLSGL